MCGLCLRISRTRRHVQGQDDPGGSALINQACKCHAWQDNPEGLIKLGCMLWASNSITCNNNANFKNAHNAYSLALLAHSANLEQLKETPAKNCTQFASRTQVPK